MNSWDIYQKSFINYLKLEKSLSQNSIDAYVNDVTKLSQFIQLQKQNSSPLKIENNEGILTEVIKEYLGTYGFEERFSILGFALHNQQ